MSKLILYFTNTGSCKKLAEKLAKTENAEIEEIKGLKKMGKLAVVLSGTPKAIGRKTVPIQPLQSDLKKYDSFILITPIWASHPVPAFNAVLELLPKDKNVDVYAVSSGGESEKDKTTAFVKSKGIQITSYNDVKRDTIG